MNANSTTKLKLYTFNILVNTLSFNLQYIQIIYNK